MKKINKSIILHVGIVLLMFIVACVYFSPVLSGKKLRQGDIEKFESMVKESKDYHAETGEYANWNSAMFSGMPSYQVGGSNPAQGVLVPVRKTLTIPAWLNIAAQEKQINFSQTLQEALLAKIKA